MTRIEMLIEVEAVSLFDRRGQALTLREIEAEVVLLTLRRCRYNQREAARALGVEYKTLQNKVRRLEDKGRLPRGARAKRALLVEDPLGAPACS